MAAILSRPQCVKWMLMCLILSFDVYDNILIKVQQTNTHFVVFEQKYLYKHAELME